MQRLPLALLLACGLALPALADSACDHPNNDFDGLYCLDEIYQQADHDLNTSYGQLRSKLDTSGRSALKASQISWLKTRDSTCSKREDGNFYVNLTCATTTIIKRTQFLQDRYRECVSSGCLDSKLQ